METASEDALLVKSEMDVFIEKGILHCLVRISQGLIISFKNFILSSVMELILFMFRLFALLVTCA
jgi:hypothetical protein